MVEAILQEETQWLPARQPVVLAFLFRLPGFEPNLPPYVWHQGHFSPESIHLGHPVNRGKCRSITTGVQISESPIFWEHHFQEQTDHDLTDDSPSNDLIFSLYHKHTLSGLPAFVRRFVNAK
jgi:hypothetical protein